MEVGPEVENCEIQWLNALQQHDIDALFELLHPDFTSTPARSSGEVLSRSEYLWQVPHVNICRYELRDFAIGQVDHTAVVKARLICDCTFGKAKIHDDLLITDVWVEVDHRWRALARHSTSIAA